MASGRLAGEGLEQLDHVGRERARAPAADHQDAHHPARRAASGTASTDRQPSRNKDVQVGVELGLRRGPGPLASVWSVAARPTSVDLAVNRDGAQLLQKVGAAAERGTDVERIARLVVLHDGAAVGVPR